jgi:hypothetical protein
VTVRTHIKVDKATFFRFVTSQAEGRFEYDRGRIVQQTTGGTLAHSLIAQRFISAFERRLDANIWAVTGHSRGVETPATVRYPDVLVEPMSGAMKRADDRGAGSDRRGALPDDRGDGPERQARRVQEHRLAQGLHCRKPGRGPVLALASG